LHTSAARNKLGKKLFIKGMIPENSGCGTETRDNIATGWYKGEMI
jgi:hypothetical protein